MNCAAGCSTTRWRSVSRLPTASSRAMSWQRRSISGNTCRHIPTMPNRAFRLKHCVRRHRYPFLLRNWTSTSANAGYRLPCTAAMPHGCSTPTCPSATTPARTSTISVPPNSARVSITNMQSVPKRACSTAWPSCATPSTTPRPTSPRPSRTRTARTSRCATPKPRNWPTARLTRYVKAFPTGLWSSRRSSRRSWRTCTTASSTASCAPSSTAATRPFLTLT